MRLFKAKLGNGETTERSETKLSFQKRATPEIWKAATSNRYSIAVIGATSILFQTLIRAGFLPRLTDLWDISRLRRAGHLFGRDGARFRFRLYLSNVQKTQDPTQAPQLACTLKPSRTADVAGGTRHTSVVAPAMTMLRLPVARTAAAKASSSQALTMPMRLTRFS